jgi:ATPase subunit of ABC transporter with duplicated ATPase domains
MPAPFASAPSISLARLSWSTPDGNAVLDDIDCDFAAERTGLVGRNGAGKSTLLRLIVGDLAPSRGIVRVTGTVARLRQSVQIRPGETVADLLGVAPALALLRRAEAGLAGAAELAEADWLVAARAAAALAALGLDVPLDLPLDRLSGGQRTRAALAGAVLAAPDFLLLDEPTNNLDRDGRAAVRGLLDGWRAGAIVISHDRELLDGMDAIVELTKLGASRYGGNWSHYRERKTIALAAAAQDLATAEKRVEIVARKAQVAVERKARRDAAGRRKAARGDMPRILIGARRDRAEDSGGESARLADRLRERAAATAAAAREQVERIQPMTVTLAPTGLPPGRTVLTVEGITAGYDPACPVIRDLSLTLVGPERVALTGANGAGKSTLLRVIAGGLAPWSGRAAIHVGHALFDQEVSLLDPATSVAANFARLNPALDANAGRAAIARFRFRAEAGDRLVGTLSGGQLLRAGLACVLGGAAPPPLLILDEPTNHLDLDSIAAVEAGLAAFDGALLVVSHDEAFLDAIGITRRIALG